MKRAETWYEEMLRNESSGTLIRSPVAFIRAIQLDALESAAHACAVVEDRVDCAGYNLASECIVAIDSLIPPVKP